LVLELARDEGISVQKVELNGQNKELLVWLSA